MSPRWYGRQSCAIWLTLGSKLLTRFAICRSAFRNWFIEPAMFQLIGGSERWEIYKCYTVGIARTICTVFSPFHSSRRRPASAGFFSHARIRADCDERFVSRCPAVRPTVRDNGRLKAHAAAAIVKRQAARCIAYYLQRAIGQSASGMGESTNYHGNHRTVAGWYRRGQSDATRLRRKEKYHGGHCPCRPVVFSPRDPLLPS